MKHPILVERSDLFDMGMVICMRIEVAGKASSQIITDAFHKAVASHEILNSRVLLDEKGNAFYVNGTGRKQSITFSGLCIDELIMQEEKKRFKVEEGEFLRAFCYQYSESGFSVLFMMHHLAGDGKSLVYFIESFLYALQNAPLPYQPMELIYPENLPKRSRPPFPFRLWAKKINRNWRKDANHQIFTLQDLDQIHNTFWKNHSTRVEELDLTQAQMERMLKDCKKAKIKFTAYLITLMLKQAKKEAHVGLAVDSRLTNNRAMSNQVTGISITYTYDHEKPFWTNAREVQKLMSKRLNHPRHKYFIEHFMTYFDGSLIDAINLEAIGAFHAETSKEFAKTMSYSENRPDLSITNLTKLDIPQKYGTFSLSTLVFIPPVISYGDNIIGLSTLGDKTTLTLHVYADNSITLHDLVPDLIDEEE